MMKDRSNENTKRRVLYSSANVYWIRFATRLREVRLSKVLFAKPRMNKRANIDTRDTLLILLVVHRKVNAPFLTKVDEIFGNRNR